MKVTDMLAGALGSLIAFLPNLLAALIILAIGLFIAAVLGNVTTRLLGSARLEQRSRVRQFVGHERTLHRAPRTGGRLVYWLIVAITAGLAIDALELTWLSVGVAAVLAYVPNVLVAAAVLGVGYLVGNFAYRRLSEREGASVFWAKTARVTALVVAGFMALQQLGVASAIVMTAFILVFGAMAVAAAVAFGFGNRELAGRITEEWYERRGRGRRFQRSHLESPFFRRDMEDRPYPQG